MSKNIWVLTDSHFGHNKLIEEKLRPEGFDMKILNFMNLHVDSSDLVIHLGDVAFKDEAHWHQLFCASITGKKWLITGNHDTRSNFWYLEQGWDFVADTMSLNMFGHNILFSHKPQPEGIWTINIHGHFHDFPVDKYEPELKDILTDKHYLLAMEYTKYQPVSLTAILKQFNSKIKAKV